MISILTVFICSAAGWRSGEWMEAWVERTAAAGAKVYEKGLIVMNAPEGESADECRTFGEGFAKSL